MDKNRELKSGEGVENFRRGVRAMAPKNISDAESDELAASLMEEIGKRIANGDRVGTFHPTNPNAKFGDPDFGEGTFTSIPLGDE